MPVKGKLQRWDSLTRSAQANVWLRVAEVQRKSELAILSRSKMLLGSSIASIVLMAGGDLALDVSGRAISPSSKFEIKEEALSGYVRRATDGDRDSAFALAQHYAMFRNDMERADHWYAVASLGGHRLARIHYAYALLERGGRHLDEARSLADDISTYDPESAQSIRNRIQELSHSQ